MGKIVGKIVERPRLTILVVSLATMIAAPAASMAQSTDYPNERITFIVGFAAGGFVDTIGR
jgi:tripartite-type tricarboxylate transporter receptor subunit TctC